MGIVMGAVECLRKTIPNAHITFLCHHYKDDIDTFRESIRDQGIEIRNHPWYREANLRLLSALWSGIGASFYLCYCALSRILHEFGLPLKNIFCQHEVVIDLNVDSLNDVYQGIFAPVFVLVNMFCAVAAGKPVVVCGASIGPFRRRVLRFVTKVILNKTKLIMVREQVSKDYLKTLGVNNPEISITADLAFLLEPAPARQVSAVLGDTDIVEHHGPLVGIVPLHKLPAAKYEEHFKLVAEITDTLIEDLDATVLYIPHSFYTPYADGLLINAIMGEIYQRVKNKSKLKVIRGMPLANELKGIINMCDIFISFVFHPLISSTSLAIPSIAIITYGRYKFYGIIGNMMGQEKCIIDADKFDYNSLSNELKSKISYVWANKDTLREELEGKAKLAKDSAYLNGVLIKKLIAPTEPL